MRKSLARGVAAAANADWI